uniref:Serpentine receptor class gamma n=1 Tax=Parastrongyloides trichosuri TaxID=131310 RepID=A0A0N4ZK04_PARTI
MIIFDIVTIIGFILTILLSSFATKTIFNKKEWHIHFRTIIFIGILNLVASSILCLILCVMRFFSRDYQNNLPIGEYIPSYPRILYYLLYLNNCYRYIQWTICIERLIATLKVEKYEKIKIKFHWLIIIIFLGVLSYITSELPIWLNIFNERHLFFIFMDIPVYVVSGYLWNANRRMARNKQFINQSLSLKFQVNENLFIMWLYFPILTFYMIQQIIFHVICYTVINNSTNKDKDFYVAYSTRMCVLIYSLIPIILEGNFYKVFINKKHRSNKVVQVAKCENNNDNNQNVYFTILHNAWK